MNLELADESQDIGGTVEICIEADKNQQNTDDLCLGFLDESKNPPEWRCEDSCVQEVSNGLFCGETDHFTNFALLLDGTRDDCEDSSEDLIYTWVSVAAIGVALCCICLIVVIIELSYQKKRINIRNTLRYLETVDTPNL